MSRRIVLEMKSGLREICGTMDDLGQPNPNILPDTLEDVPVFHGGQRTISATLASVGPTYVLYREA